MRANPVALVTIIASAAVSAFAWAHLPESVPVHFGLGTATQVDIEIVWPSGTHQIIQAAKTKQLLTVREPEK